jgi:hypothetical protein
MDLASEHAGRREGALRPKSAVLEQQQVRRGKGTRLRRAARLTLML